MSEFDYETERCLHCDGHFRHFEGCPYYTGEPVLDLITRLQVATAAQEIMELS